MSIDAITKTIQALDEERGIRTKEEIEKFCALTDIVHSGKGDRKHNTETRNDFLIEMARKDARNMPMAFALGHDTRAWCFSDYLNGIEKTVTELLCNGVLYVAVVSHPGVVVPLKHVGKICDLKHVLTISPALVEKNDKTRATFQILAGCDDAEIVYDERLNPDDYTIEFSDAMNAYSVATMHGFDIEPSVIKHKALNTRYMSVLFD